MTKAQGTTLGVIAIACWSVYGVLLASNAVTPPFRSMAIVFTFATAVLLGRRLVKGHGLRDLFRIPISTLALGVLGLFGSNCLYVVALSLGGEPVTVNIASLSWPVFMVALIAAFGIGRPGRWDAIAMIVGFSGVVLVSLKESRIELDWPVCVGLVGALCWAVYSGFRTRVPAGPPDAMIAFVGTSALICWGITLGFERGEVPLNEFIRLAAVGLIPVGLANLAWDLGARHGDPILLAGFSFAEPVASTALIAVILAHPVGPIDIAALGLVCVAICLSVAGERQRRLIRQRHRPDDRRVV